jgi:hypothetical protein
MRRIVRFKGTILRATRTTPSSIWDLSIAKCEHRVLRQMEDTLVPTKKMSMFAVKRRIRKLTLKGKNKGNQLIMSGLIMHLSFRIPTAGTLHGLAGYFEAHLYGNVGLSIHPERMSMISPDMMSWFPSRSNRQVRVRFQQ